MKAENIVTSLEVSKQLKENGWEKNTYFWWNPKTKKLLNLIDAQRHNLGNKWDPGYIPAPTFSEIWSELPKTLQLKTRCRLVLNADDEVISYEAFYGTRDGGEWIPDQSFYIEDNLADACAETWIWLKQNNYLN